MKRHINKHLKKLKREKKKRDALNKRPNYLCWPAIFCLKENFFIGVSYCIVKPKWKPKVTADHWKEGVSKFRTDKHKIDMTKFQENQIVHCPNCGGKVDFRLWLSATRPEFI